MATAVVGATEAAVEAMVMVTILGPARATWDKVEAGSMACRFVVVLVGVAIPAVMEFKGGAKAVTVVVAVHSTTTNNEALFIVVLVLSIRKTATRTTRTSINSNKYKYCKNKQAMDLVRTVFNRWGQRHYNTSSVFWTELRGSTW